MPFLYRMLSRTAVANPRPRSSVEGIMPRLPAAEGSSSSTLLYSSRVDHLRGGNRHPLCEILTCPQRQLDRPRLAVQEYPVSSLRHLSHLAVLD